MIVQLAALCVVIAALHAAKGLLIPVALSGVLAVLLSPVVAVLERRRARPIVAAGLAVGATYGFIALIGFAAWTEFGALGESAPAYSRNIDRKFASLEKMVGGLSLMLHKNLPKGSIAPGETVSPADLPDSVMVNLIGIPLALLGYAFQSIAQSVLVFLIIAVLTTVLLTYRQMLRVRVDELLGTRHLPAVTEATSEVAIRVSQYLRMQFVSNTVFAFVAGVGLWLIGFPNPLLWAVLAWVLRFLPYFGTMLACMGPVILSLAAFNDWTRPFGVLALYASIDILCVTLLEPIIYGIGTGITPLAVILSALFWAWLWGPIGLVLATPLAVSLSAIGRHFPHFRAFPIVLGTEELSHRASGGLVL